MTLITDQRLILDDMLRQNHLDWDDFEKTYRGDITISGLKYCYRLGYHMKLLRKAIMACGIFVRIGPMSKDLQNRIYKTLDPSDPDKALFFTAQKACWHPNFDPPKARVMDYTILDNAALVNRMARRRK